MDPRYIVVNNKERYEFEKEWQLPYGYGKCSVFYDLNEAIEYAKHISENFEYDEKIVIEKYDKGKKEVIIPYE